MGTGAPWMAKWRRRGAAGWGREDNPGERSQGDREAITKASQEDAAARRREAEATNSPSSGESMGAGMLEGGIGPGER